MVAVHVSPGGIKAGLGFLVESCALHASRTLVTRTRDHRAPVRCLRELVTLICTILTPYGWCKLSISSVIAGGGGGPERLTSHVTRKLTGAPKIPAALVLIPKRANSGKR
jgi:hypothetical protein